MKNQHRRNFLKAGATIGGSLFAAPLISFTDLPSRKSGPYSEIKRRTLGTGKDSLNVSALGLGCMGMSYHRGFIPDKKYMIALIRKAVDMGVNFFDTEEAYGPLKNEELIGEALAPVRKDILICSKFGFNIQNNQLAGLNSKPAHIRAVVDQSLKRLRTDHLDLLYQHRVDPNTPMEDVAGTAANE